MDDAPLVSRLQRLGNLPGEGKRFFEWKRATGDPYVEALALHELHDEEVARGGGGGRGDFFE